MYSSSFVWRFIIYLPNCLKPLLSIAFNTFILEKIESERLSRADCRLLKNAGSCPTSVVKKVPLLSTHLMRRVFTEVNLPRHSQTAELEYYVIIPIHTQNVVKKRMIFTLSDRCL
jgi:hypothetical protein